ncbi:uncharacterized protein [Lolium perenne]|uniref:uncharacterized protein n=1 Tax=Lolium perenne TaxID=4522 RepID=UPI003A996436
MADSSNEFFYDHVIDTSSDKFDDDSEILVAVALLIHEHEENQIMHGVRAYDDYFHLKKDATVVQVFADEYLRQPNVANTAQLLSINQSRGFPGYHNDIRVLQRSPVFSRLAEGNAPMVNYEINGHHYDKGYYLADGIYPRWSTFVKTINNPKDEKESRFAKEQEAAMKDVEQPFGMLQSRWAIVRHPARTWSKETMWEVMIACVIMQNMIVEEERDDNVYDQGWEFQGDLVAPEPGPPTDLVDFLHVHHELRDLATHSRLQNDLVQHMWNHVGNQ